MQCLFQCNLFPKPPLPSGLGEQIATAFRRGGASWWRDNLSPRRLARHLRVRRFAGVSMPAERVLFPFWRFRDLRGILYWGLHMIGRIFVASFVASFVVSE